MVIVTMVGETFKRYVVVPEDEYLFNDWQNGSLENVRFFFGGQAMRRGGIDEMYRSLSSNCVTKVVSK